MNKVRDLEFTEKVKKYLSSPEAISKAVRGKDSLRESLVFQLIAEKINSLTDENILSILDIGCGKAPVLAALKSGKKFKKYTSKTYYHGRDKNYKYIDELRCLESKEKKTKWAKEPHFTVGEILDYRPIKEEFYEIIIILNCIHELDPGDLPSIFEKLNSMLKSNGVIIVIDMETLPFGYEEVQAVCFSKSEIEKILGSTGIETVPITHKKEVNVFSLHINKFHHNVDKLICLKTIHNILENKLENAIHEHEKKMVATERKWDSDYIYELICLTGYICRLVECIKNVESKIKSLKT